MDVVKDILKVVKWGCLIGCGNVFDYCFDVMVDFSVLVIIVVFYGWWFFCMLWLLVFWGSRSFGLVFLRFIKECIIWDVESFGKRFEEVF